MEKKVSQINLASDPDKPYFIQVTWKKDLGFGFSVILCDGQSAWTGTVSDEEVSKDAADMEMEREKYVDELRKALTMGAEQPGKYIFEFSKDEGEDECYHFSYDKNLKDVVFRLGSLKLRNVSNPLGVITELIRYGLDCSAGLHAKNKHLQKENERLLSDWNDMQGQLEAFVQLKEELERDLYTRFTLVLNEKKTKIRSLQDKLKETQEKLDRHEEDATPTSKGKDEDYGGSTDEESKSQTQPSTSETATLSRRDSLLSSTDDVADVAPTRTQRQRVQKRQGTKTTAASQEPAVQEKKRCDPVPEKTARKKPSSGKKYLETMKNTEDPDDLFNDM